METIRRIIENEPVLTRNIPALLTLLVAFGAPISNDQVSAIVRAVAAVIAIAAVVTARAKVTPTSKLDGDAD